MKKFAFLITLAQFFCFSLMAQRSGPTMDMTPKGGPETTFDYGDYLARWPKAKLPDTQLDDANRFARIAQLNEKKANGTITDYDKKELKELEGGATNLYAGLIRLQAMYETKDKTPEMKAELAGSMPEELLNKLIASFKPGGGDPAVVWYTYQKEMRAKEIGEANAQKEYDIAYTYVMRFRPDGLVNQKDVAGGAAPTGHAVTTETAAATREAPADSQ